MDKLNILNSDKINEGNKQDAEIQTNRREQQ